MSVNPSRTGFQRVEPVPPTLDEIIFMVLKSQERAIRNLAAVNPDTLKILRFRLRNGASGDLQFHCLQSVLARLYPCEQWSSPIGHWNTLVVTISGAPKLKLRFRGQEQIIDGYVADRWHLRFAREYFPEAVLWSSSLDTEN